MAGFLQFPLSFSSFLLGFTICKTWVLGHCEVCLLTGLTGIHVGSPAVSRGDSGTKQAGDRLQHSPAGMHSASPKEVNRATFYALSSFTGEVSPEISERQGFARSRQGHRALQRHDL